MNLGYDGLFGPKTMFYHISPEAGKLLKKVSVPVLDSDRSGYVQAGTAGVVLLGFVWVLWCLLGVSKRDGCFSGRGTAGESKKKS